MDTWNLNTGSNVFDDGLYCCSSVDVAYSKIRTLSTYFDIVSFDVLVWVQFRFVGVSVTQTFKRISRDAIWIL
jgi:hypothetical protein